MRSNTKSDDIKQEINKNNTNIINSNEILKNNTKVDVIKQEIFKNNTNINNSNETNKNNTNIINSNEILKNNTNIINSNEILKNNTNIINSNEINKNDTNINNSNETNKNNTNINNSNDLKEILEYKNMPICDETGIYAYTMGGLGNQILLYLFAYVISIVHKIPVYYPSDSVFENYYNITSYFPGHINIFKDTRETDRKVFLNKGEELVNINPFESSSPFIQLLDENRICSTYKNKKIILTGFEDRHNLLYELKSYQKILKLFNLYSESIYKFIYPPPIYKFENEFLLKNVVINSKVSNHMSKFFPDYNKKRFLGVHLRFGGKYSDYKDPGDRMSNLDPNYVTNYIERVCQKTNETLVYIASDSTFMKNYIKDHITKNITVITAPLEKILSSDLELTGRKSKSNSDLDALSELYIIRHSSNCIGSKWSSYSQFACSNMDHDAFRITNDVDENII
ncbi:hypothetical protein WA158_003289 [Blastocystis sp. Blastoise]